MPYKNFLYISLFAIFTSTALHAGFPLDPDEHQETIQKGREFRAVGRIEYASMSENGSTVSSRASGTLIDSADLGLPAEFNNRVILTTGHTFKRLLGSFKRGMPKQCDNEEARKQMNAYRFYIDVESDQDKPPVEQFFEIQNVFFSDVYRPHNKTGNQMNDIAFAILKEPIPNIPPIKIMNTTADSVVGLNVQRVGYGVSGFLNSNTFFSDSVKRSGGMTVTSADPAGDILYYDLRSDILGNGEDERPRAKSFTYLTPGCDSITLTIDGQKRALAIDSLNSSIDSPELKLLLGHMSVWRLKFELSRLVATISLRSHNRMLLLDEIAGVKLDKPIRISRGVQNPSFHFSGDSGGPALAYTNAGWAIVGVTARENGGFRTIDRTPFKEKLKDYISNNPYLSRMVPKSWLEPVSASDVDQSADENHPVMRIANGPKLIQELGVEGYVSWLDKKDGHFFKRRWSRFKHSVTLNTNTYYYPSTTSVLMFPWFFAKAFAHKMLNAEKGFNPSDLNAPIYSFSSIKKS
ncbi:MAG: hypothetical protein ACTHJ4_03645 [Candidatus Nucleicultricaceae bacterium]